ncbi:hypothetical protein L2U69_08765 [Zavarzinia compransoris]|uniref:hypothetical protein n=1 Tax=Zavarzinia marina TaxID=2911065 RepID=UPI001F45DFC8|nr:hypothetical protein [Zavarzinia marina]MCF4165731.1 hypothetical protein [Zavarzinia marina]
MHAFRSILSAIAVAAALWGGAGLGARAESLRDSGKVDIAPAIGDGRAIGEGRDGARVTIPRSGPALGPTVPGLTAMVPPSPGLRPLASPPGLTARSGPTARSGGSGESFDFGGPRDDGLPPLIGPAGDDFGGVIRFRKALP